VREGAAKCRGCVARLLSLLLLVFTLSDCIWRSYGKVSDGVRLHTIC